MFPEPNLLLFVGPSVAGIIGLAVASLNPLSPCPGIAFPLRESWFLFSFSSFLAAGAFGILSTTNALPFTADVAFATSSFVAASFSATAFALANSAFADSIAEAVFSVDTAFSKAFSKRAIASFNFDLSTFSTTGLFSLFSTFAVATSVFGFTVDSVFTGAGAGAGTRAGAGAIAFASSACTFAPVNTANPEAIATLATPTLNLRIL